MRILFSHTNYPAQFRRLAPALAAEGHEVVFLAKQQEWHAPPPDGLRLIQYQPHRQGELSCYIPIYAALKIAF